MKHSKQFVYALILSYSLILTACGSSGDTVDTGTTGAGLLSLQSSGIDVSSQDTNDSEESFSKVLSFAEIDGLLFMREEEELARDLYLDIYADKNNSLNVFKNISDNAETQHAEAVLLLLEKYEINDPSTGQHNTYTDTELQALYNQLLAMASNGDAVAALKVGALVEETDIEDINIQKNLVSPEHQDIISTYDNLLCGSRNHLRAFAKQIVSLTGKSYQTQVPALKAEVQAILNSEQEKCSQ